MRALRAVFLFSLILAAIPGLASQPAAGPGAEAGPPASSLLPEEPASLLGLELGAALASFGAPATVSVLRGPEPWQDDVVFGYAGGWSLFWAGNRVWQIRFSRGYGGPVYGIFIGDSADKAYSLLGTPWWQDGQSLSWRLPWKGYPVRLRAWLEEGRIADLYLFRADF